MTGSIIQGTNSNAIGVTGSNSASKNWGFLGSADYGAFGRHYNTGNEGHIGSADYGVYGKNGGGDFGYLGGSNRGVYGKSSSGIAVYGESYQGTAVYGSSYLANAGFFENQNAGNAYSTLYAKTNGPGWAVHGENTHSSGHAGYFKGNIQVEGRSTTKVLEITGGSDLSEQFDIETKSVDAKPGMVVCIDTKQSGKLVVSSKPYDRTVAGIISGAGGIETGMLMGQKSSKADGAYAVALTGRVYVWVDASHGAIEPGDMLTTSSTPGYAMKATDRGQSFGAVIGKAMQPLKEDRGLILVLVNLQ
jgi:hypothetical protein